MDTISGEKSVIISINDILDELMVENKRLFNELLFANKLKTHLIKIHSKYQTMIDCEDITEWHVLTQTHGYHTIHDSTHEECIDIKCEDIIEDNTRQSSDEAIDDEKCNEDIINTHEECDDIKSEDISDDNTRQSSDSEETVSCDEPIDDMNEDINDSITGVQEKHSNTQTLDINVGNGSKRRQTNDSIRDAKQRAIEMREKLVMRLNDCIRVTQKSVNQVLTQKSPKSIATIETKNVVNGSSNRQTNVKTRVKKVIKLNDCIRDIQKSVNHVLPQKSSKSIATNDTKNVGNGSISRRDMGLVLRKSMEARDRRKMSVNLPRIFKCEFPDCTNKTGFKRRKNLTAHMLVHSTDEYSCDFNGCQYKTHRTSCLDLHRRVVHSNDRPFACDYEGCGQTFKTKGALKLHSLTHKSKSFVCTVEGCDRRFRTKYDLKKHIPIHSNQRYYQCKHKGCSEMFLKQHLLRAHKVLVHNHKPFPKPKKHGCEWPGCDFYGASLTQHQRTHMADRPFKCLWPECGKGFIDNSKLKGHMNMHKKVKPYGCSWPGCTYRCTLSGNLNKHMKVHQK